MTSAKLIERIVANRQLFEARQVRVASSLCVLCLRTHVVCSRAAAMGAGALVRCFAEQMICRMLPDLAELGADLASPPPAPRLPRHLRPRRRPARWSTTRPPRRTCRRSRELEDSPHVALLHPWSGLRHRRDARRPAQPPVPCCECIRVQCTRRCCPLLPTLPSWFRIQPCSDSVFPLHQSLFPSGSQLALSSPPLPPTLHTPSPTWCSLPS